MLLQLLALAPLQASGPAPRLAFDWPETGAVRVTELVLEKGSNSRKRYVLSWAPVEEGDGTRVDVGDLAFELFAGFAAADPRVADAVRTASVLGSAVPDLVVDGTGRLEGFDGYRETILDLVERNAEFIEPELWERIRPVLESEESYAALEARWAETWNVWVANWIGLPAEPGWSTVWEYDLAASGGVVPRIEVEIGETTEYRGVPCVEIETRAVADEELLLRRTLEGLGLEVDEDGAWPPEGSPFHRMSRVQTTHGFYGRDDLRPLEVETAVEVRAWKLDALAPLVELQQHRYEFAWEDLEPPEATSGD